jgi:hypothetical protein
MNRNSILIIVLVVYILLMIGAYYAWANYNSGTKSTAAPASSAPSTTLTTPSGSTPSGATLVGGGKCQWLSNVPGTGWVDNSHDQSNCKNLDSCQSGGGRASGGGCYRWLDGSGKEVTW